MQLPSPLLALIVLVPACTLLAPDEDDFVRRAGTVTPEGGAGDGGLDAAPPQRDADAEWTDEDAGTAEPPLRDAAMATPDDAGPPPAPSCCELPHAQTTCTRTQACIFVACLPGYEDGNAQTSDGCEAADIPGSGLQLWLAADRGVTVGAAEAVMHWADGSPAGHHAAPATPAAAPQRVAVEAGLSLLSFDGNDDELVLPAFAAFSSLSLFAVVEFGNQPACPSILHFCNRATPSRQTDDIEFGRHEGGALHYETSTSPVAGGVIELGHRYVIAVVHGADSRVQSRLDGRMVADVPTPLPLAVSRSANFIGNNYYMISSGVPECQRLFGRIGELLFYDRGLDATERAQVEGYLAGKWGVALEP